MTTRPLTYDDLNVATKTVTNFKSKEPEVWRDSAGRTRVHVSLKGCSFVMHTFWIKGYDPANQATRAVFLLTIQKQMRHIVSRLKVYEV